MHISIELFRFAAVAFLYGNECLALNLFQEHTEDRVTGFEDSRGFGGEGVFL